MTVREYISDPKRCYISGQSSDIVEIRPGRRACHEKKQKNCLEKVRDDFSVSAEKHKTTWRIEIKVTFLALVSSALQNEYTPRVLAVRVDIFVFDIFFRSEAPHSVQYPFYSIGHCCCDWGR